MPREARGEGEAGRDLRRVFELLRGIPGGDDLSPSILADPDALTVYCLREGGALPPGELLALLGAINQARLERRIGMRIHERYLLLDPGGPASAVVDKMAARRESWRGAPPFERWFDGLIEEAIAEAVAAGRVGEADRERFPNLDERARRNIPVFLRVHNARPLEERRVLYLFFFEDLSAREVAARTEESLEQVEWLVARATGLFHRLVTGETMEAEGAGDA